MRTCCVVDQCLDQGTIRAEFIHDPARGRLVGKRDKERLRAIHIQILDVERSVTSGETLRISET